MAERRSFTGVARRRKTSWSVAAGDRFAKGLITIGGMGTIVAVLLVLAYLVSVVLPLFAPAKVQTEQQVPGALKAGAAPLAIGSDDFGVIGWALLPDGRLRAFRLDNGKLLGEELSPENSKLRGMTAASIGSDGRRAVFGFEDGKVRAGRISFPPKFLEAANVPPALRELPVGEIAELEGGMVTRTPAGQFRRQQLKFELEDPLELDPGKPLAIVERAGNLFAGLTREGKLYIGVAEKQPQGGISLTDESSPKLEVSPIELPAGGGPPKFLIVSDLGDFLYVAWEDGRLLRFEIRNPKKARLVEDLRIVSEPGAKLTSLVSLFGGGTLIAGDSLGAVSAWFPVIPANSRDTAGADGRRMVSAHTFAGNGKAVTALVSSPREREVAAGYADGRVRLFFVTSEHEILNRATTDGKPVQAVRIGAKGDRLLAATAGGISLWTYDEEHPDATFASLFLPVWYQDEPSAKHVWQTTGPEGFEPKLGLAPLVFGTLKATFYAMIFGAPLALLAALYTSEFLHPNTRARIKPTIELMASLPSVVLGFLAGLVIAPVFSHVVPAGLAALITVPLALLLGAYFWQLLPLDMSIRLARFRFALMVCVVVPLGLLAANAAGPALEGIMFDGDIKGWLLHPHERGSATPGWMMLLLPLGAIGVSIFMARVVNPWLIQTCAKWTRTRCAAVDLLKFSLGAALTVIVVGLVGLLLDGLKFDPRDSLIGKYEELNALIVGFAMGFAIIPLIYTIADDALSAVPAHLRSASLGAGATPWQTAVRIVIPTAMSGLFSAVMIGLGRAVGETMIVLMAGGGTAFIDVNPFNGFQTLSAAIATQMPEAAVGSTHQKVLFLAALTLFIITFVINTGAEVVRQRFRRRAYEL